MGYRKIMKFVIGMICLFVIINGGYLLVSEHKKKDINLEFVNSVGNHGVHVQDNYLLYTNGNGIWSVPFIFGSRLYLYDVEQNKSYLIKNQKGILQEWGTEMCFSENYVLAQGGRGMGDPPADVKYLNLQGESQDIPIETTCMALMKNGIYYVDRYFEKKTDSFCDVIWKWNLSLGKQEKVLQRKENSFENFKIYDNKLLAIDENAGTLIVKSLITGEEYEHTFSNRIYPVNIVQKNENSVLVIGVKNLNETSEYTVIEFQLEEKKEKTSTALYCIDTDSQFSLWENIIYKEGYLYCNDERENLVKFDLLTGHKEILIKATQFGNKRNYCHVDYCRDYIVIEVYYDYFKALCVFDYDGNLIRKKLLHQD